MATQLTEKRGLTITPLHPLIGAQVTGVDLSQDLDPAILAEIKQAWADHTLLLFRGQDMSGEDQLRLAGHFGPIATRVTPPPGTPLPAGPKWTNIMLITDRKDEAGEALGALGHGDMWFHSDKCYRPKPHRVSFLYGIEIPSEGGHTKFSSLYAAYENMSDELKSRLADAFVMQGYDYGNTRRVDPNVDLEDILHHRRSSGTVARRCRLEVEPPHRRSRRPPRPRRGTRRCGWRRHPLSDQLLELRRLPDGVPRWVQLQERNGHVPGVVEEKLEIMSRRIRMSELGKHGCQIGQTIAPAPRLSFEGEEFHPTPGRPQRFVLHPQHGVGYSQGAVQALVAWTFSYQAVEFLDRGLEGGRRSDGIAQTSQSHSLGERSREKHELTISEKGQSFVQPQHHAKVTLQPSDIAINPVQDFSGYADAPSLVDGASANFTR